MEAVDFGRQLLAIVFVLGLLCTLAWKLRGGRLTLPAAFRTTATDSGSRMELVERLSLTPQHGVHRLRIQGRDLLISTHPSGCSLLAELDGEPAKSSKAARAGSRQESAL